MQEEVVELRQPKFGGRIDLFGERPLRLRKYGGAPHGRRDLLLKGAAGEALHGQYGNAEQPFERALIRPAAPTHELPLLGEDEHRPPPLGERSRKRERAGKRGILRNEANNALGVFFYVVAGGALLHAEALRRIHPGKIAHRDLLSPEKGFALERRHRDAVPVADARVPARERVKKRALARIGIA